MKDIYVAILREHFGLDPIGREDFDWNSVCRQNYPTIYKHILEFAESEKPAYEAPASEENTMGGHLANWNSLAANAHSLGANVWVEALQAHTNANRLPLSVPFRSGDWVYASPGNYIVRLPVSFAPEIAESPDAPGKMEEIFKTETRPGEWQNFSNFGILPSATEERCDICEGHGVNTLRVGNRLALGELCSTCDGVGQVKIHPKLSVKLFDPKHRVTDERFLPSRIAGMLSLLPDAQWKASEDGKLFLGTFAGGYGQFMTTLHAEKD